MRGRETRRPESVQHRLPMHRVRVHQISKLKKGPRQGESNREDGRDAYRSRRTHEVRCYRDIAAVDSWFVIRAAWRTPWTWGAVAFGLGP